MSAQEFFDLISLEVFGLLIGLGLFSWCAGYAAGYVLGFLRRITHSVT
jgi:hypothetical protein